MTDLIPDSEDPITLFRRWHADARACPELSEPDAMTLATADPSGMPSARIVLLKGVDERGFVFYTNITSAKGAELAANPKAALCFYWMPLGRQVRVRGCVSPVTEAEADAYFATRSRESQLGAWASMQSRPLDRRETLERRFENYTRKFEGGPVPRPPYWSGYRLDPVRIEFWQSRPYRLHDRLEFERLNESAAWTSTRLFP